MKLDQILFSWADDIAEKALPKRWFFKSSRMIDKIRLRTEIYDYFIYAIERDRSQRKIETPICETCNGSGMESKNQICRDCDK